MQQNVNATAVKGLFGDGHAHVSHFPANSAGSYKDIPQLTQDETFVAFAGLKPLEYIHTQFYQQKNSRDAILDTKNACFSDLYQTVDDLIKKLYGLFV